MSMKPLELTYVTLSEWRGKLQWDSQDALGRNEVIGEVEAEVASNKAWIRRLEEALDRLRAGEGEQMPRGRRR